MTSSTNHRALIIIQMVLLEVFWAATFVCGRVVAGHLTPIESSVLRFFWGVLGIVPLLFFAGGWRRVSGRAWVVLALMGLTGIVSYNLFLFAGLRLTTASRVSLITSATPVGTMLGAALFLGEKLDRRKVGGILLSVTGAIVIITAGYDLHTTSSRTGDLFILGCSASWISYTLLARKAVAYVPSITATGYSTLIGTVGLFALAAPQLTITRIAALPWQIWALGAIMGVLGAALAFKWYIDGIEALGAGRAVQFNNLLPVFTVAQSMVLLHERPSWASLAGGATVIVGLLVAQTSPHREPHLNAQAATAELVRSKAVERS